MAIKFVQLLCSYVQIYNKIKTNAALMFAVST
jgi:hypothetical protein